MGVISSSISAARLSRSRPIVRTASFGFEELPDKLHEAYHGAGGQTYLLHRLIKFAKADPGIAGGPYDMLFHHRADPNEQLDAQSEAALA
jgi:hypothetical protein